MSNGPVLVVEDNEKNMKLVREVLGAAGYETIGATTTADGIALAVQHRPLLVLMDVHLPDADGVEALTRLRADVRTAAIPVVAVTAQAMRGDRERFLDGGFDAYLAKPVDILQLIEVVRGYCGVSSVAALPAR